MAAALLENKLKIECDAYEKDMDRIMVEDAGHASRFGDPLAAVGKQARYSYFPAHKKEWPLLYAITVSITSITWTAAKQERVNSAAGIITSRLRASMRPSMVRSLVLCQQWIKDAMEHIDSPHDLLDLIEWGNRQEDSSEDLGA